MYAPDDFIAATETNMRSSVTPLNMTPNQYAEALWTNVLMFSEVNREYTPYGMFIEILLDPFAMYTFTMIPEQV